MDEKMDDGGFLEEMEEEVDFDYEFDACRHFDFSREESAMEVRQAELWFDTAETYPPSPFVIKLNLEGILEENANAFAESKDRTSTDSTATPSDTHMSSESSDANENCREPGVREGTNMNLPASCLQNVQSECQAIATGLTFGNYMSQDVLKAKAKSSIKTSFTRGSTLMKPTASHLAKQNRPRDAHAHVPNRSLERSQKLLLRNNSSDTVSVIENQAAKRQKLEGGLLRKVPGTKQHSNFIHKVPKKDGRIDGNITQTKLKLTIPREPDLETAHRAQRMRPKETTESGEHRKMNRSTFRARPLNRKILEAPSLPLPRKSTPRIPEFQVFNLKTSERAIQHSSAASSSLLPGDKSSKVGYKTSAISIAKCDSDNFKRPSVQEESKQEEYGVTHKFKARPLNKKIFSSKGDLGIFRNSKREVTIPMEFNFSTNKRFQCNPPIDLFNKLTLASELQHNTESQPKLPHSNLAPTEGSKENTMDSFQQEHMATTFLAKGKARWLGGLHSQCGVTREINEIESRANMSRSLGIR